MAQLLAVTEAVKSLSMVEAEFGLRQIVEDDFFSEWVVDLPEISSIERVAIDRLKARFMEHFYQGQITEGSVDRLLVSPLLDLAGFYEPGLRVVLVIATEISMETALPQALTYMVANPNGEQPMFGLVTNGHGFAFVKMQRSSQGMVYGFSDRFTLMARQNQLESVLRILKNLNPA